MHGMGENARSGLYSGPGEAAFDAPTHAQTPYTCLDAEYPIIMIVSLELLLLNSD